MVGKTIGPVKCDAMSTLTAARLQAGISSTRLLESTGWGLGHVYLDHLYLCPKCFAPQVSYIYIYISVLTHQLAHYQKAQDVPTISN